MKIMEKAAATLDALPPERRALFWQIVRYGLTGLTVTAIQSVIYWTLAAIANVHPQLANLAGYIAAVSTGYVLHGAFTFRDQARQNHSATRAARFVAVSAISLALNALWVWLCVTRMDWPEWTPIPAMMSLTPACVFVLNRQWVFR